jgi:mitogen-activated protein kinase kinase
MPPLVLSDDDFEASIDGSFSWVQDPSGTLRHVSGTKLSEDSGITVEDVPYTLKPSDIQLSDESLGSGACGAVKRGIIVATGQQIAVKAIKIDDSAKKNMLLTELKNLVAAEPCPHLVTWFGGFITRSIVSLVLELMDLGSLRSLSKRAQALGDPRIPHPHLARISLSSMTGLRFLHEMHVVHRDIKPENILHNTLGEVKITDFGISRSLDATMAMAGTQIGTQVYMAPEMCLGSDYNFAVDLWSYGLVLYELATGVFPLDGSTIPTLFMSIMEKPEPRLSPDYPSDLCDFVAQCLTRDAIQRRDSPYLLTFPFVTENVESDEVFAQYLATLS